MIGLEKRKDLIYIIIFLALILLVWIGLSLLPQPGVTELSGSGVCDLSSADFSDTVYVPNGYWTSYPEKLYTPEDFASGFVKEQPVPASMLDYGVIQYATHVMTLKLPAGETYGLALRTADYSMRLFVNGDELGNVGVPGHSRETTTPRVLEQVYAFLPETGTTTFVLQTANFVHREGAQPTRVAVGDYLVVQSRVTKDLFMAFLVMGALLSVSLFHLGIFMLNRSRRLSLIFSICCLLFFALSNKIVLLMFPDYNWFIAFRFEYLVHYAVFAGVLFFLDTLHPKLFHKAVTRSYYALVSIYSLLTIILDTTVFTRMLVGFEIASGLLVGYVLVMLTVNLKEKKIQNLLSFLGIAVISILGLNDILLHFDIRWLGYIGGQAFGAPFGMMTLTFFYTLVLSVENNQRDQMMEAARREIAEAEERYKELIKKQDAQTPRVALSDFKLSKRETDVALLLLSGKTRIEISDTLGISMGTVNTHCTRIYQKTGCQDVKDLLRLFTAPNIP